MAKTTVMLNVPHTLSVQDAFGYPEDALLVIDQADSFSVHTIIYSGAPGSDFDEAPNGSELRNLDDGELYVKIGAIGKKDGTWKKATLT